MQIKFSLNSITMLFIIFKIDYQHYLKAKTNLTGLALHVASMFEMV